MLLQWRQDEDVVRASISAQSTSEEQHSAWMLERLFGARFKVLIAEDDGVPIGTCTIHAARDGLIWLSYMVAKEWRRKGLGVKMVREVLRTACAPEIRLLIRERNDASIALAARLGFRLDTGPAPDGFVVFLKAPPWD